MCLATNSQQDPTQTTGVRKRAFKQLHARKREAMKEISALIESVPYTIQDYPETFATNRRVYEYELDSSVDVNITIRQIIDRWYGTAGTTPPTRWFMEDEIANVIRRATTIEAERINTLSAAIGLNQPYYVQAILLSDPYRERIRRITQRTFNDMQGFAGDTARDLARTLSDFMAQGKGVATVRKAVAERFNIKMSSAERIVRSELGMAHRGAREAQTRDARDRLGLDAGTQWISALAPTTRPWHAARHLKFYTPEQNAEFYSQNGNGINCLCLQQTVIRARDGTIIGARKETERDKVLVKSLSAGR